MSKQVADWKAKLQEQAKQVQKAEGGNSTGFISLRGGRMTYKEQEIPNGELDCIIVSFITERTMYDRPYDPDDNGPPDCFAQGQDPKLLTPHKNVPKPVAKMCKGCPKAEFGTARQGKGPACKTYRKLLVMPLPDNAGQIPEAELAVIRVPPTSVVNFSKYATGLSSQGLAPWAVSSKVIVKPHPKKQFEVSFKCNEPLAAELMPGVFARLDEGEQALLIPYTYEESDEAANY